MERMRERGVYDPWEGDLDVPVIPLPAELTEVDLLVPAQELRLLRQGAGRPAAGERQGGEQVGAGRGVSRRVPMSCTRSPVARAAKAI